ncbi:MAG: hypothetical protein R2771_10650 [Saprospiraceae bacterium]
MMILLILNLVDKFDELNTLYTYKNNVWTIISGNDTIVGTAKNIDIAIPKKSDFSILLEVFTTEGCENSILKQVNYPIAEITFIANPLVACEGDPTHIVANPNSDWTYTWEPTEGLTFNGNDYSDPVFSLMHDQMYYVTVTDGLCYYYDSVQVLVKPYFDITIEGPDYVCTDSVTLSISGISPDDSISIVEWSTDEDFNTIIATGETVDLKLDSLENKFYARIKPGTGCSLNIAEKTVINASIDIDYQKEITYCYGNYTIIELTDNSQYGANVFVWDDNPIIVEGNNSNKILIYAEEDGEYNLVFMLQTNMVVS